MSVLLKYLFKTNIKFDNNHSTIHVLFALVDHYEPGTGAVTKEVEKSRVEELLEKYPKLADKHLDSDGRKPRRTWFFPPHYHRFGNLNRLVTLCSEGYGEIELHLHHGKHKPDTAKNLEDTIRKTISEYSEFGIFGEENGEKKYAFIHGDWALDNSRNGKFCGVNNEIDVLRNTGCFADFTHPSIVESNPKQINSIYYAVGRPGQSKSYARGKQVRAGVHGEGLMIIQGPLHPLFIRNNIFSLRIMGDGIYGDPRTTSQRIDKWVDTSIHVAGKRNFIFVKTHTHGATDAEHVLGSEIEYILEYLENKYSDNRQFRLHYVTAREMYNIIKAIEFEAHIADPFDYINYRVTAPNYREAGDRQEASPELKSLLAKSYR